MLSERGNGISLNDIAHHAGVGVGTAYRRYANKEELFSELYDLRVAETLEVLQNALADPDPWNGIVIYLEGSLRENFGNRGQRQLFPNPALAPERFDASKDLIAPMVNTLAARAVAAGVVRPELTGTDLVYFLTAVGAIIDRTRAVEPELFRRYLAMFLDGIRASKTHQPLPVPALTTEATHSTFMRQQQGTGNL